MLNLDHHLRLDDSVPQAANLATRLSEDDRRRLGMWVKEGYDADSVSRTDWVRRTEAAMDLALQLQKAKSFPWDGCSNIAFPLVTIAAMQFHARAYPALVSGTSIVKYRAPAPDPSGQATQRALRVGQFMSYQVLEEDQAWEEQHDRLLLQLPIVGCAFKKSQHLPSKSINTSELVPAISLVMNYYAKSVESCPRKTHIIPFSRNDVHERCMSGVWIDITEDAWYKTLAQPMAAQGDAESDKRKGFVPPVPDNATSLNFLEQHCYLDLDRDGYEEPYIATIEGNSSTLVRLVARWERPEDVERNARGQVVRIHTTEFFTKYGLIPSPDNSVYDLGFGILLGPLNESVNSLVNMLMDSGTMSVASGGFLSRGVKIRGGEYKFSPFQWNRVDSTSDDLRKGIVELPVREPSQVLFTLLTFLVNYTQRISGSTDALSGENPGQNTPAQTQQSMIQEGQRIYSALFKRVWRSMKNEFGKLYILNARHLPVARPFGVGGTIAREDFLGDPSQISPVADPNVTSDQMRLQLAGALAERAQVVSGYDREAVERNLLQAMKVDGVETLYPGVEKVGPLPNPKVMIEEAKAKGKMELDKAKGEREMMELAMNLMAEQELNQAQVVKLLADAEKAMAEAQGVGEGHRLAAIEAMIGAAKLRGEQIKLHLDTIMKGLELQLKKKELEKPDAVASS